MEKVTATRNFIVKGAIALNLVLMAGAAFFFDLAAVIGILGGGFLSIVNFQLLERTLRKSVQYTPRKAIAFTLVNYILRYGFLFLMFYIALKRPEANIVAVIIGLLTIKVVILFGNLFKLDVFNTESGNLEERREER